MGISVHLKRVLIKPLRYEVQTAMGFHGNPDLFVEAEFTFLLKVNKTPVPTGSY